MDDKTKLLEISIFQLSSIFLLLSILNLLFFHRIGDSLQKMQSLD